MSRYGKKGGEGPTAGKLAATYRVTLPSGETVYKTRFKEPCPATLVATAFVYEGKHLIGLWPGHVAWEGDYGRLVATRIK